MIHYPLSTIEMLVNKDSTVTELASASQAPQVGNVDVTVVIVSWNVAALLADCIESIYATAGDVSVQIVVVDNASADCTVEMVRTKFPAVEVIANMENVGFARGNNQGIKLAKGEFIFLLNPDTVLSRGTLRVLIQFLREHPDAGMVGPRLIYPDGGVQRTSARRLPTLGGVFFGDVLKCHGLPVLRRWIIKKYRFPYDYKVTQEVEAICGAAMLVRREIMASLGGFGESFIHYGEDNDLCFRMRRAKWKIFYLPNGVVTHVVGQSSRQAPIRVTVNGALSQQEYFKRCFGKRHGFYYRLIVQAVQVPMIVLIGSAKLLARTESAKQFSVRIAVVRGLSQWRRIDESIKPTNP